MEMCKIIGCATRRAMQMIRSRHGLTQESLEKKVCDQLLCLKTAYFDDSIDPDYTSDFARVGYLFRYVLTRAHIMKYALKEMEELSRVIQGDGGSGTCKICCLGGGPGSEILGIAKFIEDLSLPNTIHLEIVSLDKIEAWKNEFKIICAEIESDYRERYGSSQTKWPVTLRFACHSIDLLNVTDCDDLQGIPQQDIFIISYLISELWCGNGSRRDCFHRSFKKIVDCLSCGSYFLFIDRTEPKELQEYIKQLIRDSGLKQVTHKSKVDGRWDSNESKDLHLSDLVKAFGKPHMKWSAFFVLAKKLIPF